MAKAIKVKVKMESTAGTGTFFIAEKNPRTHPEKLTMKKYDKKSKKHEEFVEKSKTLGVDDSLKTISGLDQDMIISLAENGVKTLDDLADLATDELIEILGDGVITEVEANRIIMAAREHWFADEDK